MNFVIARDKGGMLATHVAVSSRVTLHMGTGLVATMYHK